MALSASTAAISLPAFQKRSLDEGGTAATKIFGSGGIDQAELIDFLQDAANRWI